MPASTLLTVIGDFLAAIFGGLLGAKLSEKREGWSGTAQQAGAEVRKALTPHREDVLKALMLLGEKGVALVGLLNEANHGGGFITTPRKRYTENWIVNMLLKIDARDRPWVYAGLNELCVRNREEFFTHLEILSNDGYMQLVRVLKATLGENFEQLDSHFADLARKLAPTVNRLRSRRGQEAKGLHRWLRLYR